MLCSQDAGSNIVMMAAAELLNPTAFLVRTFESEPHHGSGAMDQQFSEVIVAALADPKAFVFSATAMFPGREAEPGGELAAVFEYSGITNSGDHCSARQWSDAFQCQ